MTERMAALTRTLSTWMQEQPHTLAEVEHHVLRVLKLLGTTLVAGLAQLATSADPASAIACACGHLASYQRERKAQLTTLLGSITIFGSITIWRSYYLCAECGVGQHPRGLTKEALMGEAGAIAALPVYQLAQPYTHEALRVMDYIPLMRRITL